MCIRDRLNLDPNVKVDVFFLEAPIEGVPAAAQALMPQMHTGVGLKITSEDGGEPTYVSFNMAAAHGLTAALLPPASSMLWASKFGSKLKWKSEIAVYLNQGQYSWNNQDDGYWVEATQVFGEVPGHTINDWIGHCLDYPSACPQYRGCRVVNSAGKVLLYENTCGSFVLRSFQILKHMGAAVVCGTVNLNCATLHVLDSALEIATDEEVKDWCGRCIGFLGSVKAVQQAGQKHGSLSEASFGDVLTAVRALDDQVIFASDTNPGENVIVRLAPDSPAECSYRSLNLFGP
eukprot:TRINITY_DN14309_c0_g1_i1.p1 TRINITY_DN14309_c0_g1~~TRINITY_DN14309_c0_g1_i1.p1  ORF type:complete len:290 (-),score=57.55 TRINITY_DN14309_c0_g1_i1:164-1033(-)